MRELIQQPNPAAPMLRRTMVYSTVAGHASACVRTWGKLGSFLTGIKGNNEGGSRFT